jgi:serine/threonine protein kinase
MLRERFYREARITGQLAHRNIVTVFDLGDHRATLTSSWSCSTGTRSPSICSSPKAQDLDAKIDLMMQVCEGLQNAHRGGSSTRSQASNMFVQRGGRAEDSRFRCGAPDRVQSHGQRLPRGHAGIYGAGAAAG